MGSAQVSTKVRKRIREKRKIHVAVAVDDPFDRGRPQLPSYGHRAVWSTNPLGHEKRATVALGEADNGSNAMLHAAPANRFAFRSVGLDSRFAIEIPRVSELICIRACQQEMGSAAPCARAGGK